MIGRRDETEFLGSGPAPLRLIRTDLSFFSATKGGQSPVGKRCSIAWHGPLCCMGTKIQWLRFWHKYMST